MTAFPNLHVLNHPLIQHKLTIMREKDTSTPRFRQLLREIALLMGYEVTRQLPSKMVEIETPVAHARCAKIDSEKLVIVPILRAGLGMADGLLELIPTARVGHIGLYRDHDTKLPVEYMVKLPTATDSTYILVDPMLATGHSGAYAVDVLNRHGVDDERILFLTLVAVPEGMRVFNEKHKGVQVYTASLDDHLNESAYIIPGLGDAGDRLFGTE